MRSPLSMLTLCALIGASGLFGCSSREARTASDLQWHGRVYPVVGPEGQRASESSVANATMTRMPEMRVRATVTLRGGLAQGGYPWHVHSGTCGSGGGIVGDPGEYPLLTTGPDGMGNTTATFDAEIDPAGDYYVNIHASEEELERIVACGELELG